MGKLSSSSRGLIFLVLCCLVPVCLSAVGRSSRRDIRPSTKDLPAQVGSGLHENTGAEQLEDLILMTELSLKQQKEIKQHFDAYRAAEAQYLTDPDSNAYVRELMRKGSQLLGSIQEAELEYLFDQDLLSELSVLTSIAQKKSS